MGLSQRTAPVALRERLSKALEPSACAGDTSPAASPWCGSGFRELAFLSTCNRLEVYAVANGTDGNTRELIVERLAELSDLARDELEPHVYHKEDGDAVWHLLRVACGLDSQLLGETQILGQVSQAFASARSNGTSGPLLTYLFSRAAHAGKRARSETEISRGATSISHAAVALLEKELGDLSDRDVSWWWEPERPPNSRFKRCTSTAPRKVSLHQSHSLQRSGPRPSLRLPGPTVGASWPGLWPMPTR